MASAALPAEVSHGTMPNGAQSQAQVTSDMIQAAAGISQADNIKVAVRARPLSDREIAAGRKEAIAVAPDGTNVEVAASDGKTHKLRFHCCMGPATTQSEVVDGCGATQLMQAALHGYHTTVFAYGQTGSGKTYTMFGREDALASAGYSGDDHDGLVLRSMRFLFEQVEASPHEQVRVKASCLEVYNENVYDLLNISNKPLPLKWEAERGFWVPDLRIVDCNTYAKFAHVAHVGMKNRKTGSHALNHESSRSHAILTVNLEITNVDAGSPEYGQVRFGKISFVDLAGSERVKETGAAGKTLNEANSINRSLHMLGKVISTLSEAGDQANVHVPYRDSKLTKLLMDSIGGNALCLMIACVGPTDAHTEETLNTLQYATRAKNIRNRPRVQYKEDRHLIASLRQELELLRNENHYLRSFLQQERPVVPASQASTPSQPSLSQESSATSATARPLASSSARQQAPAPAGAAPARVPHRDSGLNTPGKSPERKLAPLEIPGRSGDSVTSQAESVLSARPGSKPQTASGDSTKRLQQTQMLLAQFSEANTKLAVENDRLRRGRQTLAKDHADVLNEIEVLRNRLTAIEGNYVATTPLASSRAGSALGSHSNWSSPKSNNSRGGPGPWEASTLRPSASPSPAKRLGDGRSHLAFAQDSEPESQAGAVHDGSQGAFETLAGPAGTSGRGMEDAHHLRNPATPTGGSYASLHNASLGKSKSGKLDILQRGKSDGTVKANTSKLQVLLDDMPASGFTHGAETPSRKVQSKGENGSLTMMTKTPDKNTTGPHAAPLATTTW